MSVAKAKTLLPSEIVARKAANAYTERKRRSQRRIRAGLPGETKLKRGSERLKRLYKTKTSLAKAKMLLPSETVPRKGENALTEPKCLTFKPITDLPSEDVPRKGENAYTERKRSTKRRNRL